MAATRTVIARSGIGVEVRAGARKPDISSVDAFKQALLTPGPSPICRSEAASIWRGCSIDSAWQTRSVRKSTARVGHRLRAGGQGRNRAWMTVITQILTTLASSSGTIRPRSSLYVTFVAGVVPAPVRRTPRDNWSDSRHPAATAVIKAQGSSQSNKPTSSLVRAGGPPEFLQLGNINTVFARLVDD